MPLIQFLNFLTLSRKSWKYSVCLSVCTLSLVNIFRMSWNFLTDLQISLWHAYQRKWLLYDKAFVYRNMQKISHTLWSISITFKKRTFASLSYTKHNEMSKTFAKILKQFSHRKWYESLACIHKKAADTLQIISGNGWNFTGVLWFLKISIIFVHWIVCCIEKRI